MFEYVLSTVDARGLLEVEISKFMCDFTYCILQLNHQQCSEPSQIFFLVFSRYLGLKHRTEYSYS